MDVTDACVKKIRDNYQDYFDVCDYNEVKGSQSSSNIKSGEEALSRTLCHNDSKMEDINRKEEPNDDVQLNLQNSNIVFEQILHKHSNEEIKDALAILRDKYSVDISTIDSANAKTMIENIILLNWYSKNILEITKESRKLQFNLNLHPEEGDAYLYQFEDENYKTIMKDMLTLECREDIFYDHEECECYDYHSTATKRRKIAYDKTTHFLSYYPFYEEAKLQNLAYALNEYEINFHPLFYKTIICKQYNNCPKRKVTPDVLSSCVINKESSWSDATIAINTKKYNCMHAHGTYDLCPFVHSGEKLRSNLYLSFRFTDVISKMPLPND